MSSSLEERGVMVPLTDSMVTARTKSSDMESIRKLNFCGCNLSDISLVRQMHRVELLSLSVNEVSTLQDIQYCTALEELFLRKNKISDINQICYLQNLPHLRSLMLKENPCADIDRYRWTVLRALPNLARLDDVEVTPQEVEKARQLGDALVHPEKEVEETNTDPILTAPPNVRDSNLEESTIFSAEEQSYIDTMDTRNANYQAVREQSKSPPARNQLQRGGIPNSESCDNEEYAKYRQRGSSDGERDPNRTSGDYGPEPINCSCESPVDTPRNIPMQWHFPSSSDMANIEEEISRPPRERPARIPRRISQMNSNVLSAVLLLIKELDYSSLEIVENAVHCALNDYEDN